jgi:SAM-dependent methyltransferase
VHRFFVAVYKFEINYTITCVYILDQYKRLHFCRYFVLLMSNCPDKKEWFATWFDSTYYHQLYAHRSHDEASAFIPKLVEFLQIEEGGRVLDLACGKGRHSFELAKLGLMVTGVDLSPCSIAEARQHQTEHVVFEVQDMRDLKFPKPFHCILNLFTSFGYFEDDADNALVLSQVYRHLQPGGLFVLDYFNAALIDPNQVLDQQVERDGVSFIIKKYVEKGHVYKNIDVHDGPTVEHYQEKVQLLTPDSIATMLHKAGFHIFARFGNYQLDPLDVTSSPRCLMVAQKPL